jgi:carbonic anhydrase
VTEDPIGPLLTGIEEMVGDPNPGDADGEVVVRVSCSMASQTAGVSLWPADVSWTLRVVTTLGNQTREECNGERVLNGGIAQSTTEYDLRAVQVVGHTGCRVVEEAYERSVASNREVPAGIGARLDPLTSLVSDAVAAGVVDPSVSHRTARYRLVEYNVLRQVEFLCEQLRASGPVVGYVHDENGAYGSFPHRHYLVSVDGETDPETIRADYPETESVPALSLL